MILGQTVRAAWNHSGLAREDLVIKTGVGHGPVEVLSSQHIAAKLSVVCDPGLAFIIVSCFEDGCLVSSKPGAFSGNLVVKTAAMQAKHSSHVIMLLTAWMCGEEPLWPG